ncbi:MAG: FAD-dependent oxidoreductase [Clostridioides sp.]|jgi:2-enoate reductase|nr:FAD-dependent oxidoreductase [Clostridioides sp.]
MSKYKDLFSPIKIGKCEIPNRFFMAPMGAVGMADVTGAYNDKGIEYYTRRARGGTGLIITGITKGESKVEYMATPGIATLGVNNAAFMQTAAVMCERVHAYNSKIFLQIGFGFGRVMIPPAIEAGAGKVAPSKISNRWNPTIIHDEMTTEEVEQVIKSMVEDAAVAKAAGFDGVEVHAVHEGYLLDQFTLEIFNQRTDKYGGSFENRYRAAVEIIKGIKKVCGEDFPVSLRYTAKSFIKGIRQGGLPGEEFEELGRDMEEGVEAAKHLVEAGYDALNVDCGTYEGWYWNHPPMYFEDGMYLEYAKKVKEAVDVPVMVAGRMDNPDLAIESLHNGSLDMVGLGRPLLADADLPEKIRRGHIDDIRPCLSCQDGCLGKLAHGQPISCAVNPACGNENAYALTTTDCPKNVLVVGGGIAGMEAARVLALRGHKPTVVEASGSLGGALIAGGMANFKNKDHKLMNWYIKQLKDLDIEIKMNTKADLEMIEDDKYDVAIIATGATPIDIKLQGNDKVKVVNATEALLDIDKITGDVAIIGAGLVGAEAGLWMAQRGNKVTIVEMTEQLFGGMDGMCFANYDMLKDLLKFNNVEILTGTKAERVDEEGLVVKTKDGVEKTIKADNIITAVGYNSDNALYEEAKFVDKEIHLIGDSKNVHNIMYAVWDAFEVARHI